MAPSLNLKYIAPPVIPRISYTVVSLVIRLCWTKLPLRFYQNWFLLQLLSLKRCTFQGFKLTYEILGNRISYFIPRTYCICWELSYRMFIFAQKFKVNKTYSFFGIFVKIAFLPITSSILAHFRFWDRFWYP